MKVDPHTVAVREIFAVERQVRALRDEEAEAQNLPAGRRHTPPKDRGDLNPVRHYALALTALEDARLRVGEAHRLIRRREAKD